MRLAPLTANPEVIAALSDLLVEVVANGASVSFMHPLAQEVAADFWSDSLARAARGTRVVLGAWEGDALIATVTLDLATPPNQAHRADIAKLMTRLSQRGRGVAQFDGGSRAHRGRAWPHAVGPRYRRRWWRGGPLGGPRLSTRRHHSGLRTETAWRPDRDHHLLQTDWRDSKGAIGKKPRPGRGLFFRRLLGHPSLGGSVGPTTGKAFDSIEQFVQSD
jgi:hypothetical protein